MSRLIYEKIHVDMSFLSIKKFQLVLKGYIMQTSFMVSYLKTASLSLILIAFSFFPSLLKAQTDRDINITVNWNPKIDTSAQKIQRNVSSPRKSADPPIFNYVLDEIQYKTNKAIKIQNPVKYFSKDSGHYPPNYAYIGAGMFNSVKGGLFLANAENQKYSYFVKYLHNSSDQKNSLRDFSDNTIGVGANRYFGKSEFGGKFNYFRNGLKFYNRGDSFKTSDGFASKLMEDWNFGTWFNKKAIDKKMGFEAKVDYHFFITKFNRQENEFSLKGAAIQKLREVDELKFDGGFTYMSTKQIATLDRYFFDLNGTYLFPHDDYKVELGFTSTYLMMNGKGNFYINPVVKGYYELIPDVITAYAGLDGGLKKQNLRTLNLQNPFLGDSIKINNTYNSLHVFGGVKGKISNNSELNIEIGYENVAKMPLFIVRNDSLRTYGVVYDDVTVLSIKPEFQLSVAEKIRFYLFGKLSSFKTTDEEQAWLMPTAWFRVGGSYNISDKVILKAEIEGTNQRQAKELSKTSYSTTALNGFVDANLGIDFKFSPHFHAWVNVNNIAGKQYQWFYRYPNYSLLALGGLALSF